MGWGGGGFVPGRADLVQRGAGGGGRRQYRGHDGYYDVEGLIAARPDVLAYGDDYIDTPSLRADQNCHPRAAEALWRPAHRLSGGAA